MDTKVKRGLLAVVFAGAASLIAAYYNACVVAGSYRPAMSDLLSSGLKFLPVFIISAVIVFLYLSDRVRFADTLFKYRYAVAGAVLVVLVILKVNASSLGVFERFLGSFDDEVVFGLSRGVRSDEWAVFTPMLLSQYEDPSGAFSYMSSVLRGGGTDVFLEYGQPAWTILMLFRPFQIPYLFLPLEYGLSFFWCGRLIALFMCAFEFGRIITKDRRGLSVAFAVMISFAPVVQWWFAINGLVEMLICILLSIVLFNNFLNERNKKMRLLYIAGIMICAGTYVFTFYPAWQVPLAYVLLGLIAWQIMDNFGRIKLGLSDYIGIAAAVVLLGLSLLLLFVKSGDTLTLLTNTVYPGKRFEVGGGRADQLFTYIPDILFPVKDFYPYTNVCEGSMFFDMFPLIPLIPVIYMVMKKKADKLMIIMTGISAFMAAYITFGFPHFLAKITLMSHSMAPRVVVASGLADMILLFRYIAAREKSKLNPVIGIGIAGIVSVILVLYVRGLCPDYYSKLFVAILCAWCLFAFAGLFIGGRAEKYWLIGICFVTALTGIFVNPIRSGVKGITKNASLGIIETVHDADPEAVWAVCDSAFPFINAPIMVGAPTINSTNIYPNMDRWHLIDEEGRYEEVYNRYAHIDIEIDESLTEADFAVGVTQDRFTLRVNAGQLIKLGVKYIFTGNGELDPDSYELVAESGAFYVYRLKNFGG